MKTFTLPTGETITYRYDAKGDKVFGGWVWWTEAPITINRVAYTCGGDTMQYHPSPRHHLRIALRRVDNHGYSTPSAQVKARKLLTPFENYLQTLNEDAVKSTETLNAVMATIASLEAKMAELQEARASLADLAEEMSEGGNVVDITTEAWRHISNYYVPDNRTRNIPYWARMAKKKRK